jgi:Secretion system C-terminal sorting domain
MKKSILFFIILCKVLLSFAQNKSGYSVIWGGGIGSSHGAILVQFDGSINKPVAREQLNVDSTILQNFIFGHSGICDSANGDILFTTNGMRAYDTLGNLMENGDSLQPYNISHHNSFVTDVYTQGSIVLPKGSNGLYYMFTNTIRDSSYNYWIAHPTKGPFDLLQYHVIDANANGGMGKVVQKNVEVIKGPELNKVGMMACRHANGYDWWILKQGSYDSNVIYKIFVTAYSVVVKDTQVLASPAFGIWDFGGQSAFSKDGKRYAYSMGRRGKLFIADFDRCSGELHNPSVIDIPYDSTADPQDWPLGIKDSMVTGVCFSANGQFIYISKQHNIYQYEWNNSDSSTAWYRVKFGSDTTLLQFEGYGQLYRGEDNRVYIGKRTNLTNSASVIDNPDIKGIGCNFCRKCLRFNDFWFGLNSPANMPDFNLGADSSGCWPVSISQYADVPMSQWEVYPNPASNNLFIKNADKKKKELYNSVGQLIFSTTKNEIDVSSLSKGVYYLKCAGQSKKVVIE